MKKRRLLWLILFAALAPLFANDGYFEMREPARGGSLYPAKSRNISMVKETIAIEVSYEGESMGLLQEHLFSLKFTCDFRFRNEAPAAERVLMGFPVRNEEGEEHSAGSPAQSVEHEFYAEDFSVFAHGKELPAKKYEIGASELFPELSSYDAVFGFTVDIPGNGTVDLRNVYTVGFRSRSPSVPIYYILNSARTWARPIGDCEIVLTVKALPFLVSFGPTPGYPTTTGLEGYPTLRFRGFDLVPSRDFSTKVEFADPNKLAPQLLSYIRSRKDAALDEGARFAVENFDPYRLDRRDAGSRAIARWVLYQRAEALYDDRPLEAASLYEEALGFGDNAEVRRLLEEAEEVALRDKDGNSQTVKNPARLLASPALLPTNEPGNQAPSYYCAYNLACIHSLLGSKELAKAWLGTALRLGYSHRDWLLKDPDLAASFGTDELEAILALYAGRG